MTKALRDQLVDAAQFGDANKVGALLARSVSPNSVNKDGTTALYAAAMGNGRDENVRLLLAAGADPNVESMGPTDGTPLCGAASWGWAEVVQALLAHGADPNRREDGGTGPTPLWWAARGGHGETVRLLLEAGADADAPVGAKTALLEAVERGSVAVVELLLAHGADASLPDADGRTPLAIAEAWSETDIEASLRDQAAECGYTAVVARPRTPMADGTELVAVEAGGARFERQTGHARIAAVLREGS